MDAWAERNFGGGLVLPSSGKNIGSHTQDPLTDVVVACVQKRDINGKKKYVCFRTFM